jgi:ubiquinone/menaquinone biosynthesis C-methylase UbiE
VDLLIEATHRAEADHFWFRGFRQFVRIFLAEAAAAHPQPRILDCGCGTGVNFRMLDAFGRPFGFDLNRLGLSFARESGHTCIARASATHIPFGDASFDIVTSFDVLQTLPDGAETAAVTEMYRVLRPGGTLVANVAALDVLFGNHSVLAEEVRRYSRRSLRTIVETAGFRVRRITYTNATLFPVVLAVRTFQRAVGLAPPEHAHREISIPPAPLNTALAGLLALEARALRRVNMPFGSSLLCLAEK